VEPHTGVAMSSGEARGGGRRARDAALPTTRGESCALAALDCSGGSAVAAARRGVLPVVGAAGALALVVVAAAVAVAEGAGSLAAVADSALKLALNGALLPRAKGLLPLGAPAATPPPAPAPTPIVDAVGAKETCRGTLGPPSEWARTKGLENGGRERGRGVERRARWAVEGQRRETGRGTGAREGQEGKGGARKGQERGGGAE
jgi:hypothetical protein